MPSFGTTITIIVCILTATASSFIQSIISSSSYNISYSSPPLKMTDQQQQPPTASSSSASSRAIDFLTLTRSLKTTKRTGWVMRGVHSPESIADHMYRMSLMSMIASFSDGRLDTNRCIQLALIHDLAEAKVGDITPHCKYWSTLFGYICETM